MEGKKSVTIRLDEPDLMEWADSQSSALASIRMAIKICILQYGKNIDLLDAILKAQFGDINNTNVVHDNAMMSDKHADNPQTIEEQISDNTQTQTVPPSLQEMQTSNSIQTSAGYQNPSAGMQMNNSSSMPNLTNNNNADGQTHGMSSSLQSLL